MSASTSLLFLITCGQFLLSLQGLTLRLKGKEIIPNGGKVNITKLPVGGCRRYDSLECLSDVPYRGRVENAYWEYTDPYTLISQQVDTIRCESDGCKSTDIGWWSNRGIYKKDEEYNGVVRLGRHFENARWGLLTCFFEGDTVSVTIDTTDYSILTAPIWIKVTKNVTDSKNNVITTISWDAPPGGVDFYTFYYDDGRGECFNETLDSTITSQTVVNGEEIQIATHRNDMTKCSKVFKIEGKKLFLQQEFPNGCSGYCEDR